MQLPGSYVASAVFWIQKKPPIFALVLDMGRTVVRSDVAEGSPLSKVVVYENVVAAAKLFTLLAESVGRAAPVLAVLSADAVGPSSLSSAWIGSTIVGRLDLGNGVKFGRLRITVQSPAGERRSVIFRIRVGNIPWKILRVFIDANGIAS